MEKFCHAQECRHDCPTGNCMMKPGPQRDRIALLEGALANAHEVFAAEIEGLHKIILMNQPDYKRTIVASVDGL